MSKIARTLERIYNNRNPNLEDLESLFKIQDDECINELFMFADKVRSQFVGDGIALRGIIEFSNYCRNSCSYCGISSINKDIRRFRMSKEEIIESIRNIVSLGVKTVVLQSGEDPQLDACWMKDLIEEIRLGFDIAITLCVGERPVRDYILWREAGADRYLLKIETTDKKIYSECHPQMSFESRLRCLDELKELGYQVGSGNIIGLPGQNMRSLAEDVIFFKEKGFDMIGIGPFIPHSLTPFSNYAPGDAILTLKAIALTRIVTRNAHIPATTALGSLERDFRIDGLRAGANVLMPNFTPQPYRRFYEIYPGKRCVEEPAGSCPSCMEGLAALINRRLDYSRADSLKMRGAN